MEKVKDQVPWFGIEQEYTLRNATTKWPLGALPLLQLFGAAAALTRRWPLQGNTVNVYLPIVMVLLLLTTFEAWHAVLFGRTTCKWRDTKA